MNLYLAFILLLSLASSNTEINKAGDGIVKALSHFHLLNVGEIQGNWMQNPGAVFTFVHAGRGAEHVIDIKVTKGEKSPISLELFNAKAKTITKTFDFSSEIFDQELELYAELVSRLAREKGQTVYFTSFDDFHMTLKKLMPQHIITYSVKSERNLAFLVFNKDTPIMSIDAQLIKVEKTNSKVINQDFKIEINALFSNNNQIKNFKQSFSVFSKTDFSELESLLADKHLESLAEIFEGSKNFFEGQKKLNVGASINLPNKAVAAEIKYIGSKILVNLSQELDKDSQLPKFTVKLGKVNEAKDDFEIKDAAFSKTFTRLTQANLDSILKEFDVMSLFDSFDKMIIAIYKKVHKETYEISFEGAALRSKIQKPKSSGGLLETFGLSKPKEVGQVLDTIYKDSVIASFEVVDENMNGVMTFTNANDNSKFVFQLPINLLTVNVVENYLRALLMENVKVKARKSRI